MIRNEHGMVSVHDVASYVVEHFRGPISTMKLQKLTYMAQGWSLALLGEPLFPEKFDAWRNGPVSRTLFACHRREYSVSTWPHGNPTAVDGKKKIVLDAALKNYEALTGAQLSELTHRAGTPWSIARQQNGVVGNSSSNVEIPNDLIREHFRSLLVPQRGDWREPVLA